MRSIKWSTSVVLLATFCHFTIALPRVVRVKRDEEVAFNDQLADLNPIEHEDSLNDGLDREKRKLPDAAFGAKNALIGFVFSKIDNVIDSKTRLIEQLDRTNVEKNRLYNITAPAPINDLQTLITAVVSPKINSVGNLLSSLTTGILGGITSLSGASGGANGDPNAGLGQVVSKVLRLSGPILQGSAGGGSGASGASGGNGGSSTAAPGSSDEAGY